MKYSFDSNEMVVCANKYLEFADKLTALEFLLAGVKMKAFFCHSINNDFKKLLKKMTSKAD